jgi:hypothetical protein
MSAFSSLIHTLCHIQVRTNVCVNSLYRGIRSIVSDSCGPVSSNSYLYFHNICQRNIDRYHVTFVINNSMKQNPS